MRDMVRPYASQKKRRKMFNHTIAIMDSSKTQRIAVVRVSLNFWQEASRNNNGI